MTRVTIDSSLQAKLHGLESELELCDESGRTVGFVLPPDLHRQLMYAWAKTMVDEETVQRSLSQPGGLSTAQVLDHLDQLEKGWKPQT